MLDTGLNIKNQRRKCCIRDAPKIRQKEKKGRRSHWTLNWFSGSVDIRYHFWHLKFIVVLCKEEEAKGFAPSSIGLPHFLQPSRIFQCRYHQNEPCTLRSLSADSIKGKKVTLKQHAKNMHSMLTPKHKKALLSCTISNKSAYIFTNFLSIQFDTQILVSPSVQL